MEAGGQISRKGKHSDGASDISGSKLTKEEPTDGRQVKAKLLFMNKGFLPSILTLRQWAEQSQRGGGT